jgi:uncharacterized protein (DUF362 family)
MRNVLRSLRSLTATDCVFLIGETDSVGGCYADTKFAFQGYHALVEEFPGTVLLNLSSSPRVRVKNRLTTPFALPDLELPEAALSSDLIVQVGKIKSHNMSVLTGAIKGCFGCIPHDKSQYHPRLHHVLADMPFLFPREQLCIFDGNPGMQGDGPVRGEPLWLGAVLYADDIVECDLEMAKMLGVDPRQVRYLAWITRKLGLPVQRGAARVNQAGLRLKPIPGPSLERRVYIAVGLRIQALGQAIAGVGHVVHGMRSWRQVFRVPRLIWNRIRR